MLQFFDPGRMAKDEAANAFVIAFCSGQRFADVRTVAWYGAVGTGGMIALRNCWWHFMHLTRFLSVASGYD